MKVEMLVQRPGDVQITMTSTMTVSQWELIVKALTENLNQSWNHDVAVLRDAYRDAIERVRQKVVGNSTPQPT